ncbi:hypothetical protein PM082_020557 [Marasmius tenuissimus]|nr:hypothetical protein PM082_020557 [Marasmius tenuissimus]
MTRSTNSVTVYCGSSTGSEPAYLKAATSIGTALAKSDRRLVYGGGNKGLMGAVSRAVVAGGGRVTGIIPVAMVAAGGEQEKVEQPALDEKSALVELEPDDEKFQTILVPSMHTRKVEMARRSCGFIGLPGGYGTFEEVCEAITWTQLGIHDKPVVLINVLGFYEPFRQLIEKSVESGFIQEYNESLVVFVDCPREAKEEHETFDWGSAALDALDNWHTARCGVPKSLFDWSKTTDGGKDDALSAT